MRWPDKSLFPTLQEEVAFHSYMEAECERKETLCELFSELEEKERNIKKPRTVFRKYERFYRGGLFLAEKTEDQIFLVKENGNELGPITVGKTICQFVQLDDFYEGRFGFRDGEWRILSIFCIGSELSPETNPALN